MESIVWNRPCRHGQSASAASRNDKPSAARSRQRGAGGARARVPSQNPENNPMQSSLAVAGLRDPGKTF
jgi:hypothetical protein